jgi:hypothetical protein
VADDAVVVLRRDDPVALLRGIASWARWNCSVSSSRHITPATAVPSSQTLPDHTLPVRLLSKLVTDP